jgi:RNA polymerase sigma factor (sigma-70 family)
MSDGTRLTDVQAIDLLPLIRGKVRKFIGGQQRHAEDRRDLIQDVFVGLLDRLHLFDQRRGSLGDFVATVVDSVLLNDFRHQHAAKRDRRRDRISLNAPVRDSDGNLTELARLIAAEDQQIESKLLDLLMDVSEMLRRLAPSQREFCEKLKTGSVAEVAEQEGVARGTGYRRLKSVRTHLQNESLREYLD